MVSLAGKLIREGSADIKQTLEDMLRDGCIRTGIDEQITHKKNEKYR